VRERENVCVCNELTFFPSTGSASIKAFHSRLDDVIPRSPLMIDRIVDFFAGEDKYWSNVVSDPDSWKRKKKRS
jgi:hypothetical protein